MMQDTHGRSAARLRPRERARAPLLACLAAALAAAPAAAQQGAPARLTLREVVAATLAQSADIAQSRWEVEAQAGGRQAAAGAFDPLARASVMGDQSRTPYFGTGDAGPGTSMARTLDYGAGVDWRLRSGVVLTPGLSYSRVDGAGEAAVARNTGVASVGVLFPLLRGRGGGTLTASERAAATTLDASRADLAHVRASSVLSAVNAYWGYLAAVRTVEVLREAEGRAEVLLRQTMTLIQADERPAVDRLPVLANLASKRAARLSGESGVASARQALAQAMGLAPERLATLPAPADAFPATPDSASAAAAAADREGVVRGALERRADLAAASRRREASRQLLDAARAEQRARLDLNLTVGYTGIATGPTVDRLFTPFYAPDRGVHARMGFSYGLPLGNHAAGGAFLRSTAADRRAEIARDELAREIALAVATAAETLERTVEELRLSDEAVRLHTLSVESESQKFRLGTSTLFDVIQAEDGLTGATLSLISTQRRYAAALAQLRFQTGALVGGPEGSDVDFAGLSSWAPAVR